MNHKPNKHFVRGEEQEALMLALTENEILRQEIDGLRSRLKNITELRDQCFDLHCAHIAERSFLIKQLQHERSERLAAQRTIAILGGGES